MDLKIEESTRLYFVDNIRTLLVILVLTAHLAIAYGATGGWYYF